MKDWPLLPIALFWIVSGAYITVKLRAFLRNTQFPWTSLPYWAARLLGIVLLIGAVVMLRIYFVRNWF